MGKATRGDQQLSAELAVASVKAAEAYLAEDPDPDFIRELRAAWKVDGKDWKLPPPSPIRMVKKAERHARALLPLVGTRSALGRSLTVFLYQIDHRDAGNVQYRRRLATEPEDTRFALVLANHAFTLSLRGPTDRRVSGRLAAVLAKAEGVKKPLARRKRKPDGDAGGAEVRAWEAQMSRANRMIARWRSVD